jgi:hypothetical protein
VRSIIYNYQGGAGGEGYVASKHGLPHEISKSGKVMLHDEMHNLPKKLVQEGNFFDSLMQLNRGIYLTHHLYLLNDNELKKLAAKHEIISIDARANHHEIFLLRLFKDYARKINADKIPLILNGDIKLISNPENLSLIHHLSYNGSLPDKINHMIKEYANGEGPFFKDNVYWHHHLNRIPGERIVYKTKPKLGHIFMYGQYWNLDDILSWMIYGK